MYTCAPREESSYTNQVFSLTRSGEIRREETCAGVTDYGQDSVQMNKCVELENADPERIRMTQRNKQKQTWRHERHGGLIRNAFDNQCLSTKGLTSGDDAQVRPCDSADPHQKWSLQTYV